ncbi:MAG: type II methionyl aminopeptidase [Candidatus Micrarchaeota archaeon]|nr:type II methionyl aminopeptidase [Candidatus Micrarchaeota archaeon]
MAEEESAGKIGQEGLDADEGLAKVQENFSKAGSIASSVLREVPKLVLPGESLLDIAESLEKMIVDAGGKVAFPANISINDVAAHFTPEAGSSMLIGEKDLVKIDIGAHIDGCIGDAALTVDLSGEHGKLVEASEAALAAAIASMKPGVKVGQVGEVIEKEIASRGFRPIENLTGHKIEQYALHAGVEIPNIKTTASYELKEGDIFALEPFASSGSGRVADTSQVEIFSLVSPNAKLRMKYSRELLAHILDSYLSLPFAERWLAGFFKSRITLSSSLRELLNAGALRTYPVLRDTGRGLVAQREHTVIIEHDSARVLTPL